MVIMADVVKSGIGFLVFGSALLAWALTFAYGGEELFGSSWEHLAVYDIADKYGQVRFSHRMCSVFTPSSRLLERCKDVVVWYIRVVANSYRMLITAMCLITFILVVFMQFVCWVPVCEFCR